MVLPPQDCRSEFCSSSSTLTFSKQASWTAATLLLHPTGMTTAPFHLFSETPASGQASEQKKSLFTMSQKSTGVRWRRIRQYLHSTMLVRDQHLPRREGAAALPTPCRAAPSLQAAHPSEAPAQPLPRFYYFILPCSGQVAARESCNSSLLLTQPLTVCSSPAQHESSPRGQSFPQ